MSEDTMKLLEECNSGCKMGINSMNQVSEYVEDDKLKQVIDEYRKKHVELEDKSSKMLQECGKPEKEPGVMASAFSWLTAEMKLMIQDDGTQIAKLLMNGCNMGIQKITEHRHEYAGASKEADQLAADLVDMEENFMRELKAFL